MDSVVIDFETAFYKGYTLSTMTTEQYVRDPRFETILCGFKINREASYWVDGPAVGAHLRSLKMDNKAMVSHHAHFDGLIAAHHYGVHPKLHIDTLSMARAIRGARVRNSLAKIALDLKIGIKGDDTKWAFGLRRADFTAAQLVKYGAYCCNDCDLEYLLAQKWTPRFCREELLLIDTVVRCFTEPVLWLHKGKLERYVRQLHAEKLSLLVQAGIQLADVMSDTKFAEALANCGVEPPTKLNAKGEKKYAFAKTDAAMQELAEHDDNRVQVLVAARLRNKSTINETRGARLVGIASRGAWPVYYSFSGAGLTHRLSGGDSVNAQNFTRGSVLRDAVEAPDGMVCVVGDSSNVEARMLDWSAGQDDMVEAYRLYDCGRGPDIYCVMGEKIYGRVITKQNDPEERQFAKNVKLGLGYGAGAVKFVFMTRAQTGKIITLPWAKEVVDIYRGSHRHVMQYHKRGESALQAIAAGRVGLPVDERGIATTCKGGILLPNGLKIKYTGLRRDGVEGPFGEGWEFWDGRAWQHIYGAKVIANVTQALARILVMWQCLMVGQRFAMSSHDEGMWIVPEDDADAMLVKVRNALRTPLDWCRDMPINCAVGFHKKYGRAKV